MYHYVQVDKPDEDLYKKRNVILGWKTRWQSLTLTTWEVPDHSLYHGAC